jgi:hypothetical protein
MDFFKKNSTIIATAILVISISSCVAIFVPNRQKINFTTTSKDATVYVDNEEVGKGKIFRSKIEKTGCKQIIIKNEGYKDQYKVLLPERKVYSYWPLIISECWLMPAIAIDLAISNNSIYSYPKQNKLTLKDKYIYKTENEKYVNFEGLKLNIENKERDISWYDINHSENLAKNILDAEKYKEKHLAKDDIKESKKKKKIYLEVESKKIVYENIKLSENVYNTLNKIGYIDTINQIFLDNNNSSARSSLKVSKNNTSSNSL